MFQKCNERYWVLQIKKLYTPSVSTWSSLWYCLRNSKWCLYNVETVGNTVCTVVYSCIVKLFDRLQDGKNDNCQFCLLRFIFKVRHWLFWFNRILVRGRRRCMYNHWSAWERRRFVALMSVSSKLSVVQGMFQLDRLFSPHFAVFSSAGEFEESDDEFGKEIDEPNSCVFG